MWPRLTSLAKIAFFAFMALFIMIFLPFNSGKARFAFLFLLLFDLLLAFLRLTFSLPQHEIAHAAIGDFGSMAAYRAVVGRDPGGGATIESE